MPQRLRQPTYVALLVSVRAVAAVLTPQGSRRKARTRGLVVLALLGASCSGSPHTVERISIDNPTAYDLDVDVTGGDRDGWLPLAIIEAQSEDVAQDVVDQGEVWIFRFMHFGDPVGELRLTRAELAEDGWRVEVPSEVEDRLQQLGRPTSEEITGVPPAGEGGG
jgi:hypothetical protein